MLRSSTAVSRHLTIIGRLAMRLLVPVFPREQPAAGGSGIILVMDGCGEQGKGPAVQPSPANHFNGAEPP